MATRTPFRASLRSRGVAGVCAALGLVAACGGSVVDVGVCKYAGKSYAAGQTFPATDGCNSCSCQANGEVACSLLGCVASCSYGGMTYLPGDTFPSTDGCGACSCASNGAVSCVPAACEVGCAYGGPTFDLGDDVPAGDGCNTCTCATSGFNCTKVACSCNPGAEFGRDYVGNSPAECAVIDFGCPANTQGFENPCGCGCEQALWCPSTFSCVPGPNGPSCDTTALHALCPYTTIAI